MKKAWISLAPNTTGNLASDLVTFLAGRVTAASFLRRLTTLCSVVFSLFEGVFLLLKVQDLIRRSALTVLLLPVACVRMC